jgi:multicomponent Na+:H+ antiporter subunit C
MNFLEIASIIVFFIGFFGIITGKNIIKSIASIGIMEIAVVVFFLSFGFSEGMIPPIGADLENVADPLPQALVITAIIMSVAVTAVNLTMLISLYRKHKSSDWDTIKKQSLEN